jgi:hypothetical protein
VNSETKQILRNAGVVFAAVLGGVTVIMLVEMLGMVVVPPVPDPLPDTMKDVSVGSLLIVELAYVLGALGAGWGAAKLDVGRPMLLAGISGAVLTLAGVVNLVMFPHPVWFSVLSVITFVPMALLGARLGGPGSVE